QPRPERDEEDTANERRHDVVGDDRRGRQERAEDEARDGKPAGRTPEITPEGASGERQDRQVPERGQHASHELPARALPAPPFPGGGGPRRWQSRPPLISEPVKQSPQSGRVAETLTRWVLPLSSSSPLTLTQTG